MNAETKTIQACLKVLCDNIDVDFVTRRLCVNRIILKRHYEFIFSKLDQTDRVITLISIVTGVDNGFNGLCQALEESEESNQKRLSDLLKDRYANISKNNDSDDMSSTYYSAISELDDCDTASIKSTRPQLHRSTTYSLLTVNQSSATDFDDEEKSETTSISENYPPNSNVDECFVLKGDTVHVVIASPPEAADWSWVKRNDGKITIVPNKILMTKSRYMRMYQLLRYYCYMSLPTILRYPIRRFISVLSELAKALCPIIPYLVAASPFIASFAFVVWESVYISCKSGHSVNL